MAMEQFRGMAIPEGEDTVEVRSAAEILQALERMRRHQKSIEKTGRPAEEVRYDEEPEIDPDLDYREIMDPYGHRMELLAQTDGLIEALEWVLRLRDDLFAQRPGVIEVGSDNMRMLKEGQEMLGEQK